VLLSISQNCLANDLSDYLGLEVSEFYQIATNYLDRIEDDFSRDESVNLLRATPHLSWAPEKWLSMYICADFIWQNPVTNEDDDEIAVDLTAAYLNFHNQTTNLTLGGQTIQFGRGLILTDETLAAALNWRTGKTYIDLKAARILDASPMVGAAIGYRPGLFEHGEFSESGSGTRRIFSPIPFRCSIRFATIPPAKGRFTGSAQRRICSLARRIYRWLALIKQAAFQLRTSIYGGSA
jgi:hypothetical protein